MPKPGRCEPLKPTPPLQHIDELLHQVLAILTKPRPIEITVKCVHEGASVAELRAKLDPIRTKLRAVAEKYQTTGIETPV